jgi:hypothetical protein
MSKEVELQERPQIKGFYFEGFLSYPFNLYRDRLVVYNYANQAEHVINLSHDQVLAFLRNVINKKTFLELDDDTEYEGSWLSGTEEDATRKYNAYIEASNVAVRAALPPEVQEELAQLDAARALHPAEGGKRHKRKSHKKRKSQKKRSGKKRGHKKSRRH